MNWSSRKITEETAWREGSTKAVLLIVNTIKQLIFNGVKYVVE